MKLIVGLGNRGEKYTNTRHNAGFIFVDLLAEEIGKLRFEKNDKLKSYVVENADIVLAKPDNYMNNSGSSVAELVRFYKIELNDLYIAHDDLDLKLGNYKITRGKGPYLHNGVESVEKGLGSSSFWRIRLGVDNRSADNRIPGKDYVLSRFEPQELEIIRGVSRDAILHLRRIL